MTRGDMLSLDRSILTPLACKSGSIAPKIAAQVAGFLRHDARGERAPRAEGRRRGPADGHRSASLSEAGGSCCGYHLLRLVLAAATAHVKFLSNSKWCLELPSTGRSQEYEKSSSIDTNIILIVCYLS